VLAAADAIQRAADSQRPDGAFDPEALHGASLQVSQAKVAVDELSLRAGWQVFEVGGASATRQLYDLDRHWRNARTVTSHNPAVYKARAIGDHAINATPLPQSWFI
jgi:alkylation response protein AidB-like acyl-CoA dehydrogenase